VLQIGAYSVTNSELLCAVAVGQFKESKRYQATQAVVHATTFNSVQHLLSRGEIEAAAAIIETCVGLNLEIMPITSQRYPRLLREIPGPPPVLYVQKLNRDFDVPSQAIGVVGTRAASIEVCRQACEISANLARAGMTVVSGLALGIDGAAHRGALQSGLLCPTIAVLAHGLDRVYPPTHIGLAREILDAGGLIVSEYAPGIAPRKHHFLARNRIIAGLSRGVVVVQAGARSGSLVTANCAADYGRDVFIVSGAADDERSSGGDALIEQGAIAITAAAEVLREYNLSCGAAPGGDTSTWTTMSLESFATVTSLSPAEILRLEFEGRLMRLPGNQVRVSPQIIE
jgi:DNA processing protein